MASWHRVARVQVGHTRHNFFRRFNRFSAGLSTRPSREDRAEIESVLVIGLPSFRVRTPVRTVHCSLDLCIHNVNDCLQRSDVNPKPRSCYYYLWARSHCTRKNTIKFEEARGAIYDVASVLKQSRCSISVPDAKMRPQEHCDM